MNLRLPMSIAWSLALARIFKKNRPLFVSWAITNRCNGNCLYCRIWNNHSDELTTRQCLSLIAEMVAAGTKIINFTGGEPLLREDIAELVDSIHEKGISVTINSNGTLFPDRAGELKRLSALKLSLDGPEKIHDFLRGQGSFAKVIRAAEVAKSQNLKFSFCAVLSKHNLQYLDEIINIARKFNTTVSFQPAIKTYLGSIEANTVYPSREAYRQAIGELIRKKAETKSAKFIYNSLSGLRHLYSWPGPNYKMDCAGGRIFCRIEPDGSLKLCARSTEKQHVEARVGFRNAFASLKSYPCGQCWCVGVVEANQLFTFNPDVIFNLVELEMLK